MAGECFFPHCKGRPVATPNYAYEKRQRELAKKKKKEEKAARKAQGGPGGDNSAEQAAPDNDTPADNAPPAEPRNAG